MLLALGPSPPYFICINIIYSNGLKWTYSQWQGKIHYYRKKQNTYMFIMYENATRYKTDVVYKSV
jgi:hypothetical protein